MVLKSNEKKGTQINDAEMAKFGVLVNFTNSNYDPTN
jgi:hypothetical protein